MDIEIGLQIYFQGLSVGLTCQLTSKAGSNVPMLLLHVPLSSLRWSSWTSQRNSSHPC